MRATNYISLDRATAITTIKDSDGTEIVESIEYLVTKETGAKWKCEKPAVKWKLGGSTDQPVVVGVVADPKPVNAVRFFNSEGPVSDTDAD